MNKIAKMVLTLLGILAVLGYTFYNYTTGARDLTFLIVCTAVLGIPFVNILNILIQELKNR